MIVINYDISLVLGMYKKKTCYLTTLIAAIRFFCVYFAALIANMLQEAVCG